MLHIKVASIKRLLNIVKQWHDVDFSDLSEVVARILVEDFMLENAINQIDDLIEKVQLSEYWYDKLVDWLMVPDTEIFRDPAFWVYLRDEVFPKFNHDIRIWFPAINSGEELFSLLIALNESDFTHNYQIDINSLHGKKLEQIQHGFIQSRNMSHNTDNYHRFHGPGEIEQYFVLNKNKAFMHAEYLKNVNFAENSFLKVRTDEQYNLVLFRNKLIYHNESWQNRALSYIHSAIKPDGLLALGIKETLENSSLRYKFVPLNSSEHIYKKKVL